MKNSPEKDPVYQLDAAANVPSDFVTTTPDYASGDALSVDHRVFAPKVAVKTFGEDLIGVRSKVAN